MPKIPYALPVQQLAARVLGERRETRDVCMSWLGAFQERFLSRPWRGLWVGIAFLGVVAVMTLVVPAEPLGVDQRWSEAILDIRTSFLTDVALVFNWLGRRLGWAMSLAAVGIVLLARRRWILVGRPRPPDGLVHPVGSSFPSGHAAYAGATCVALVLLFAAPGPRRRWWSVFAALVVFGMAWSRTYLQVHWLSDVIGGSLLGLGIALTVFAGLQLLIRDVSRPPHERLADRAVLPGGGIEP